MNVLAFLIIDIKDMPGDARGDGDVGDRDHSAGCLQDDRHVTAMDGCDGYGDDVGIGSTVGAVGGMASRSVMCAAVMIGAQNSEKNQKNDEYNDEAYEPS
ncbi:hypothetical protein AA106556_0668 [Neokomagataea tanensis NBRC 106556]|uniref:Uncharacterized protein n=1 Tax=Neokomagataea tanensis NBRC 106556 TaxID=1223519 RepID=A0ABQ0QHN0_9PROT|nr:hypothetical protein AA106556_0668 [Neokomagataea tanensis NBRC 106556]